MDKKQIEDYRKAGSIAKQIKEYCKKTIKQGEELGKLAERIEAKIKELGGDIGFPVNLCIDDLAAHSTPALDDDTPASGLLKIDIGVSVNGAIADTAITIDLTEDNRHKEIIKATEEALKKAIELVKKNKSETKINEIGAIISKTITDLGFTPIQNLSGHSIDLYQIHSGITIPNYDNKNDNELGEGVFAIEPFATYGNGIVYEGDVSGDYQLVKEGQVRDPTARQVLTWLKENKSTLPFSERELEREFGSKAKLAIKRLEEAGIIKSFGRLIEKSHQPTTQIENTLIIYDDKVEVISD